MLISGTINVQLACYIHSMYGKAVKTGESFVRFMQILFLDEGRMSLIGLCYVKRCIFYFFTGLEFDLFWLLT